MKGETRKSAFDLVQESKDNVVNTGIQGAIRLDYDCPRCGDGDLHGESIGHNCICWCEECREELGDDDMPTWGIHDIVEQYVLMDSEDITLRVVPAERVELLNDA